MTDTGQVPGEGLPENAGMVEQPGVPAHGAYTYLSETTAEDEDLLLLPGAQSAWGNEVAPPTPEPVVEAVHEPGPHEMSGRDSGSVDLNGVRLPGPAPVPPTTPRRPLHLGPPIPDASASPVRSLADRGAVGAPVRQPGPPTTGPEYLDIAQPAPQGAAPWGAPAPASQEAQAAETVVPQAQAQAAARVQTAPEAEAAPGAGPQVQVAEPAGPVEVAAEAAPQVQAASEAAAAEAAPQAQAVAEAVSQVQPGVEAQAQAVVEAGPQVHAVAETAVQVQPGAEAAVQVQDMAGAAPQDPAVMEAAPQAQAVAEGVAQPEAVAAEAVPQPAEGPEGEYVAQDPSGDTAAAVAEQAVENAAPVAGEAPTEPRTPGTEQAIDAGTGREGGQAPESVQPADPAAAPESVQAPDPAAAPESAQVLEAVAAPEAAAPDTVPAPEAAAPDTAQEAAAPEAAVVSVTGAVEAAPETAAPGAAQTPEAPQAPDATAADAAQAADVTGQAADATAQAADEAAAPVAQPAAPVAEPAVPDADQSAEAPAPTATEAPAPDAAQVAEPVAPEADETPEAQITEPAAPAPARTVDPSTPELAQATQAPAAEAPSPEAAAPATPAPGSPEAVPFPAAVDPTQAPEPGTPAQLPTDDAAAPVAAEEAAPEPSRPAEAPAADAQQPQPYLAEPAGPQVQPLGQFVPVEGSVPTTPHLAPTPPQPLVLPAEGDPTVPAPREGDPDLVQNAEDLDTRAADQEESTAPVAEARQSTGPAAPAYDDAEREAVLKVMRERRDIRNGFRSDPIPHEVLLRVLEAAHTAPSVGHSQPWDFVVIRSADTRRAMHELAMRQREAYAKSLPKGRAKQFKELKIEAILDTPVNIVVTADPTRGGRHTLGRHTQPQMAPYSAALAVENLWLAARAEGLGVGWVSFFDEREMVRSLGLPEHLEVIAYLCVGYVDEFPDEPELMQAGWSKRRPLSWVVHEETYGRRALPGEEPHDLLAETVAQIRPLDAKALGEAWERQKRMTKPAGALGMLEIISAQLSGLSRQCPPPIPEPAAVAIFAGDHGVHAQGVTPWPQEVTAQMVANFLGGGAVCNAFAGQVGAEVCVVDVGVAADLPATPGLLPRKVRAGTSDMTTGAAMTREECKQAIEVGIETARDLVAAGNKALLTGEMGIANTTASAALISVFTGADPAEVTGRGTGINDETLARKTEVVRRALELHQPDPADPIGVLAAIGGFEHAAMVGLLLGGASLRTPVILDGVSAGAAALVARAIAPEVLAACIAGHRSAEPGHVAALNKLGLRPLVDLDLRLGEGTGALLALPLVQSTARAMHEVATFDSAGVTEK
ncbi:nicotinate-nucleotide--dimethylbenzimidazole phosphoribosyltransferase [Streptomyces sp. CC219B]|uniref:nicotinate-nucleotide--dimethylbenzimidazole phosphoribosyltransferase n=1 Tax=Streptomyces sp. CC219B TaxID=3044574 RepID=UPI0024A96DFD|nr:nicotinate-nucleotide--dimethylbenzimidazole phosphoribosyltransferase [Streptomyces sp. CC219B]